jgi:hypothetical protein
MLRVLAPAGHLIYTDLIVPDWAARIGEKLAPRRAGYPTSAVLERLLTGKVEVVHLAKSPLLYEGVFLRVPTDQSPARPARPARAG